MNTLSHIDKEHDEYPFVGRDELINCSSLKRRENWLVTRKYIIYAKIKSIK